MGKFIASSEISIMPDKSNEYYVNDEFVQLAVKAYWMQYYRDNKGECKLCYGKGKIYGSGFDDLLGICICPKGMKLRKENE